MTYNGTGKHFTYKATTDPTAVQVPQFARNKCKIAVINTNMSRTVIKMEVGVYVGTLES